MSLKRFEKLKSQVTIQPSIEAEKRFEVIFRDRKIDLYVADLIIEGKVIVELKCCESLVGEHQAQLINYLKVSGVLVGLLVNFGKRKVEYRHGSEIINFR